MSVDNIPIEQLERDIDALRNAIKQLSVEYTHAQIRLEKAILALGVHNAECDLLSKPHCPLCECYIEILH